MEEKIEKKPGFFKCLQESKKKQVIFFTICMTILIVSFEIIKEQAQREIRLREDNFSWIYQIDSVTRNVTGLVIEGWAFELDKNSSDDLFVLILQDTENGKKYFPRITYKLRDDVNDYFACEYDYSKTGFSASISQSWIKADKTYEILLRPKESSHAFVTGMYLKGEQIWYTDPQCFEMPNIPGLEWLFSDGILRVYDQKSKTYVYQYNKELYWIIKKKELDRVNGRIEYQMNTTQPEKLPEERINNGWLWSNLGFNAYENQVKEFNTSEYLVVKNELPIDYSITNIWTGLYTEMWLWRVDFRPIYYFE